MMLEIEQFRRQLRQAGMLSENASAERNTWYVRLLLGLAGWVSAGLLLPLAAVLWLEPLSDEPVAILTVGLVCCVVGVGLQRVSGEFARQAGSAVALAGVALVGLQTAQHEPWGWLALMLLGLILYGVGKGEVHRFLCGLVTAIAFVLLFAGGMEDESSLFFACLLLAASTMVLWYLARPLGELQWAPRLVPMALAWTLVVSLAIWWVPGGFVIADVGLANVWLGTDVARAGLALLPVLVVSLTTWRVAQGVQSVPVLWLAPVVVLLLLPLWWVAPGIGLAVCWLVIAFVQGRLALGVVGTVALLGYLAGFYYQMETPLLQKALWLGLAGAVLVVLAWILHRFDATSVGNGDEA